jgi:hypothetical protein
MRFKSAHWLGIGLLALFLQSFTGAARGASGYDPTPDGGNFGLGLELGDPGNWGVSGKVWIDRRNAFQGAVKLGSGAAILQLDYLWHDFDLIQLRKSGGEMPFYIGAGGDLSLEGSASLAGRVPVGLSYIFNKKNVPLDLFLQAVPTLWFYSGGARFYLYGELGAHYYF